MTCSEITDRVLGRTDDDNAVQASRAEVVAAANEGQELASFLTLCLEQHVSFLLPGSTPFVTILSAIPDYICPLRLEINGVRVRPATLADFTAENDLWQSTAGTPTRYSTIGFDLWAVNRQPVAITAADLIYARSPLTMVESMTPEIPEEYHQSLVKFGKYRVRIKEGAQGLARGMQDLNQFLDDMTRLGSRVRARSSAAKFDTLPIELQLFDRARLMLTVPPAHQAPAA